MSTTILARDWAKAADAKFKARGNRVLDSKQRLAKMKSIMNRDSANGTHKIAEAMVGPISIRVNYEGISRQALVEDLVPRGEVRQYPVLNDIPKAYSLSSNDGEVRISHIEGKAVIPTYGRIASEWEVDRSDIELLAANVVEYSDNQTVQSIMMEEDNLLYNGLDLLIQDWKDVNGNKGDNDIQLTTDVLDLGAVLTAQGQMESQRAEAKNIIANPKDMLDIYRWDALIAGMQFKDNYFAGYKQKTFGDWNLLKSVTVPAGRFYVTAPADMLGVFSTRYGLEETDDVTGASKFKIRAIFDELVSEVLVNRNGVVRIRKANTGK